MLRICVIGAGQRGKDVYGKYILDSKVAKVVAVVEPNQHRRIEMIEAHHIEKEMAFTDANLFFEKGKICDAVIISTMDYDHFDIAMKALTLGYNILLEKPISPNAKECLLIEEKAKALNLKVIVCHVLRYTPFFSKIKEIIDSEVLGRIVTIQHSENIGNFHMAHSFVRGNWKNAETSSPLILQKSCHDMDLLAWLTNSTAVEIASFGELTYFKEENAPKGSSRKCLDCPVNKDCRFDAKKIYLPVKGFWPATAVCADQTEEGLLEALNSNDYGKCVYKMNNNVCDHQVTIIKFNKDVTATFNLSGFTNKMCRTIKIMFEHGELFGDDGLNEIILTPFVSNQQEEINTTSIYPEILQGFHGGGDTGLMDDFISVLCNKGEAKTSIEKSIESHMMSFAAEASRHMGKTIRIDQFRKSISES